MKKINVTTLLATIAAVSTAKEPVNPQTQEGFAGFSDIFKKSLENRGEAQLAAQRAAFEELVAEFAPTTLDIQAKKKDLMKMAKKAYLQRVNELKLYDHALKYAMDTGNFFPLLKVGHADLIPRFCEVLGVDFHELSEDCFLVPEEGLTMEELPALETVED